MRRPHELGHPRGLQAALRERHQLEGDLVRASAATRGAGGRGRGPRSDRARRGRAPRSRPARPGGRPRARASRRTRPEPMRPRSCATAAMARRRRRRARPSCSASAQQERLVEVDVRVDQAPGRRRGLRREGHLRPARLASAGRRRRDLDDPTVRPVVRVARAPRAPSTRARRDAIDQHACSLRAAALVPAQEVGERAVVETASRAVAHDRPPAHQHVARRRRTAAHPSIDGIRNRPRERQPLERPHREVGVGARREHADFARPPEARRPTARRHLESVARPERRGARAEAVGDHRPCAPRATSRTRRSSDDAVDTDADRRARRRSSTTGATPTPINSPGRRAVRDARRRPAPSRAISAGSGKRQWATHVRRLAHPTDSNHSTGRQP